MADAEATAASDGEKEDTSTGRKQINRLAIDTDRLINPLALNHHGYNMAPKHLGGTDTRYRFEFMRIIEPMQLFNLMMRVEPDGLPAIANPNYLLLLDARRRETFDQSHIALAKFSVKTMGEYNVPYCADVETKEHIVIYDDMTDVLKLDDGKKVRSDATRLARVLHAAGARHTINILRGGYILFSKLYPFLRTNDIIYLPKKVDEFFCYPLAIVARKLYLGSRVHGESLKVQLDLKLTAIINCCQERAGPPRDDVLPSSKDQSFFYDGVVHRPARKELVRLHLPQCNHSGHDLCMDEINKALSFIGENACVLIYDPSGREKAAAICVAYMMYRSKAPLQAVLRYFQECHSDTVLGRKYLDELCELEKKHLGIQATELRL